MKQNACIVYILTFAACSAQQQLTFKYTDIEKIEIVSKYLDKKIKMKANFREDFIADLNTSKAFYTEENLSTHKILIYNTTKKIDTLLTDGFIHQNKSFYKSKENLIKKYSVEAQPYLNDTVLGKLKTFEKLQIYLKKEKYNKVSALFVEDVQWFFKEVREKDKDRFKRWCLLWTFDKATYNKYVKAIIQGRENFFNYENKEWKINQK